MGIALNSAKMKNRTSISVDNEVHKEIYKIGIYGETITETLSRIIAGYRENERRKKGESLKQEPEGHDDKEKDKGKKPVEVMA